MMTARQTRAANLYRETKTAYEMVYGIYNPTLLRWYKGEATRAEYDQAFKVINVFLTACELASREIELADYVGD